MSLSLFYYKDKDMKSFKSYIKEASGFPTSPGVEVPNNLGGSLEVNDLPLSRFGGRFGKDENTPYDEFLDDDGISHIIEGGLTMKIRYEMMPNNNSCKVYASIA